MAGDSPFTWTKQVAGSLGGTRNPLVVHWPNGIKAKGEVRPRWHHVIDLASTILEAAGLPEPTSVNGVAQTPIDGVSMLYSFADAKAKDTRKTQYVEIFGNRGIYHDGWLAHTIHKAPWEGKPRAPFLEDRWELYHVEVDFSGSNNLASENPDKLKELQELFLEEAAKNHALPLDDRLTERFNAALVGDGLGKGGTGALFVNDEKVAEGKIDKTQGLIFSADEGADVGVDGETPVTPD